MPTYSTCAPLSRYRATDTGLIVCREGFWLADELTATATAAVSTWVSLNGLASGDAIEPAVTWSKLAQIVVDSAVFHPTGRV